MNVYKFNGITFNFESDTDDSVTSTDTVQLTVTTQSDVTSFSYDIIDDNDFPVVVDSPILDFSVQDIAANALETVETFEETPGEGDLPRVDVDSGEGGLVALNSLSLDAMVDLGAEVDALLGQVTWGAGKVTQVLVFDVERIGEGTFDSNAFIKESAHIFVLGGDPFPALTTAAQAEAFDESITQFSPIPDSSPLAAGKQIPFATLPGVEVGTLNDVTGTNADDTLIGTAGDDLITALSNDSEDKITGTAGEDIIDLYGTDPGSRDFYTVSYADLADGITYTSNVDTLTTVVEKNGTGETDNLIDAFWAMNWNFGDGIWIGGTDFDDTFNINNAQNSTWTGLQGGAGADTFNIEGGTIVRVSHYSGATEGVDVNLVTGVIANDGHGSTDQINNNSSATRVEIEGTDFDDMILGSYRDERFILREGNDTLDAGGGTDYLRYDRSGVTDVYADLDTGTITGLWNGEEFEHTVSNVEELTGARETDSVLIGNEADNYLRGGTGDDTLDGGDGNDRLQGRGGDDWFFGGQGFDYVEMYDQTSSSITLSGWSGAGITVSASNATHILYDVEELRLADTTIDLTQFVGPDATAEDDILYGTAGNDTLNGLAGDDSLYAREGDDRVNGGDGNDTIEGGDGSDILVGGEGNDSIRGGDSEKDLRDVIYGGNGNDDINGGYGNDELRGDAGNDTIAGDFGADTVIGGAGDDLLTGSALGDILFGGDGDDFVNGGFGYDRVNGGAGADEFYHIGIANHGSDWIQDYDAAEGDVLYFGKSDATLSQFQINVATTPMAGEDGVDEAFIVYKPTGQIIWALVDGDGQDEINLRIGADTFDLMA